MFFHFLQEFFAGRILNLQPNTCSYAFEQENLREIKNEEKGDENDQRLVAPGSGLQLSIDIRGVDSVILKSKEKFTDAVMTIIKEASLSAWSYNCVENSSDEKLQGMQCIGLLSRGGSLMINTWFKDTGETQGSNSNGGVVIMDLLSYGDEQLQLQYSVIPAVETVFGVKAPDLKLKQKQFSSDAPFMKWSLLQRNCRGLENYPRNVYFEDLGGDYTADMNFVKTEVRHTFMKTSPSSCLLWFPAKPLYIDTTEGTLNPFY